MSLAPQIIYDVITKSVAIMFGHELVILEGPFSSRTDAMAAAMEECARRNWLANDPMEPEGPMSDEEHSGSIFGGAEAKKEPLLGT